MRITQEDEEKLKGYVNEYAEKIGLYFYSINLNTETLFHLYFKAIPYDFQKRLYKYLNDNHIETAMSHICKHLGIGV